MAWCISKMQKGAVGKRNVLRYAPLCLAACSYAVANDAPAIEEVGVQRKAPKRIFKEEVSAYPDDYLFDPENWEHDEENNEIVVSKGGEEKSRYEVPESWLSYQDDVGEWRRVDKLAERC